jgi:hypothetical protein
LGGAVPKRENEYQPKLKAKLERRFPGCFILKNDEQYLPGIPDLMVLYRGKWAALEVKRDQKARNNPEPNQEYYVDLLNSIGYSAFIYPEVEEEVLDALQQAFES